MFLHANFLHILFNMLVFISFAPMVEKFLGKGFPYFYILAGIFAASLNIITTNSETAMIGASGAVFGVLAASALIEPNNKVYLFFIPIGVKIKWVLPVILAVELFSGVYLDDNVGHFAHIGGALYGLIHISCVNFFKTIKDEERNG
jgi:membrane associated rhomboid family serine protease